MVQASGRRSKTALAVLGLLAACLLVSNWRALTVPFINDDYFFLDKTRDISFFDLWKPERLYFQWYRPWSRELHYWVLSRIFGHREILFHAASFVLWLASAALYYELVARITRDRFAATVAVTGVAALSLWAGPLFWVAGVQDLWMLVFAGLFLHAVVSERQGLASAALALALLSKETAAVLPAIATAYELVFNRVPWRRALWKCAGPWAVLGVWAVLHPTLRARLLTPGHEFIETTYRLSWPEALIRTGLSQLNLDQWPAPERGWWGPLFTGVTTALLLVAALIVVSRRTVPKAEAASGRVIQFGILWAVLGWAVLLLPSIGWHPYYGVLGTFGCWTVIGALLSRRRATALVVISCLALLRGARADTPSWDWGSEWYQFRAGAILGAIRERLFHFHPTPPPASRLFFARLPNNIGLLAGDGPAVRIWYKDPSLRAMYYSAYAPRTQPQESGRDFFFRFDTVRVLVEVRAGPESLPAALQENPDWRHDHEVLASLFIRAGDLRGAAREYRKLALAFPDRADYALYAGAAHEAVGERAEADVFYRTAARAYGSADVRARSEALLRALPPSIPP